MSIAYSKIAYTVTKLNKRYLREYPKLRHQITLAKQRFKKKGKNESHSGAEYNITCQRNING